MTGKIIKGIAGFYYVHVVGMGVFECKAKGILRNKKIKPLVGDNVEIDVQLITPVALNEQLRFAIREGGRTVGAGQVTKILD